METDKRKQAGIWLPSNPGPSYQNRSSKPMALENSMFWEAYRQKNREAWLLTGLRAA